MRLTATYYQTSIRRLRRNVRDDVQRELVKARLETDLESVDWLNSLMGKCVLSGCQNWPIRQNFLPALPCPALP